MLHSILLFQVNEDIIWIPNYCVWICSHSAPTVRNCTTYKAMIVCFITIQNKLQIMLNQDNQNDKQSKKIDDTNHSQNCSCVLNWVAPISTHSTPHEKDTNQILNRFKPSLYTFDSDSSFQCYLVVWYMIKAKCSQHPFSKMTTCCKANYDVRTGYNKPIRS